jgi:hypothetical protein
MDFAKYVAMLEGECLNFSRLDLLGDPFEGSLSRAEFVKWRETAQKGEADGLLPDRWKGKYFDVLLHNARAGRKQNYVSCWHMNVGESEAMWRLYSQSGYAIAVQSTYEALAKGLPSKYESATHRGPFFGVVKYVNHHEDVLPQGNVFHAVMQKRLSFAHEHECRAVVWCCGDRNDGEQVPLETLEGNPSSINVPVNFADFAERVVVSPSAPNWFADLVSAVTRRYGHATPVVKSTLTAAPYL